jgi:hypothetical protein
VLQPGVRRPGIDQVNDSELLDSTKTLEKRAVEVDDFFRRKAYRSPDGVIELLSSGGVPGHWMQGDSLHVTIELFAGESLDCSLEGLERTPAVTQEAPSDGP